MQGAYHNHALEDAQPGDLIDEDIPADRAPDFYEQATRAYHSDPEEPAFSSQDSYDYDNTSDDFDPRVWASQDAHHEPCEQLPEPIDAFDENDEQDDGEEQQFVGTLAHVQPKAQTQGNYRVACFYCKRSFKSNNLLHKHVRKEHFIAGVFTTTLLDSDKVEKPKISPQTKPINKEHIARAIRIVKSTAPPPIEGLTTLRNWYELRLNVKSSRTGPDLVVCPDTGAAITLADENFVKANFPNAKWEQLPTLI
ncbi:unnamed protein product [Alternaria burnsii]|nr:unnamed protein product [Alternaria burnsii]